jgi:hypothetical protein
MRVDKTTKPIWASSIIGKKTEQRKGNISRQMISIRPVEKYVYSIFFPIENIEK